MNRMGKHSPPVDGVPVANGHAPVARAVHHPASRCRSARAAPWRHGRSPPSRTGGGTSRPPRRAMLAHRGWLAAIPVILVNAVAFYGQLGVPARGISRRRSRSRRLSRSRWSRSPSTWRGRRTSRSWPMTAR